LFDIYYKKISIDLFVKNLNKYATTQNYTVVQDRNKISKQNIYIKYWIQYDCDCIAKQEKYNYRLTSNRYIEYFFKTIAKLENNFENKYNLDI